VTRTRRSGGDQGSAAVEFVLVLPVLLLVLFAIVDFGRLLNAKIVLSQAAHEGARAAAIADDSTAVDTVNRIMGGLVDGMDEPSISGCGTESGTDSTVTLTYHFAYVTPLGIFGFGGGSGETLTASAVVPCL
jgi:Flp pilus assembly protein TadG